MKKSLSILLSFALVFGLFASMASAADTELTVAQKYQALVDKGVLKGNPDGDARLDANLNRAEFATIAIAISGLAPEKPATATFSDVNSKQWWYGAIEAAAKAGLVEGYNGKFDPKANVTVEQVIKVAVQAAGLETDEKAEAVEGASDWAAKYIKAALDAGLIATGLDYKADATRGQTILVGYSVYEKLNPVEPAKVSVTKAEATGVKQVTVTLDKAVDTEKAAFALKKGTASVALDKVKWSEDKKVATLPLKDVKISEGEYTVTLSGVEDIATASASFKAENETVKTIEFVTTSKQIAKSKAAKIKLAAKNQYGENASFNASSYTANASGYEKSLKKDDEGYLILTVDTVSGTAANLVAGVSIIPVYVYFDDTRVMTQQNFTLGTQVFVSGLELGDLVYKNGKEALSKAGESAEVIVKLFDQYGNPVTPDQVDADNAATLTVNDSLTAVVSPYSPSLAEPSYSRDDDQYKVVVSVKPNAAVEAASTHTVTVYAGGASKSTSLALSTSRVAAKVKIGDIDGVIAAGDSDIIVPLVVTDADGNELTAQEIVDNEGRINVVSSGAFPAGAAIERLGKNKGKIKIAGQIATTAAKSYGFVSASIATQHANSYDYKQFKIDEVRIPDSVVVSAKPHVKAVLGANSDFDFAVKDQYGATLDYAGNDYAVDLTVTNTPATGKVVNAAVVSDVVSGLSRTSGTVTFGVYGGSNVGTITQFNDGFYFDTIDGNIGTTKAVAVLKKIAGANQGEVSKATATIESIDNSTPLFYTLGSISDKYAAIDSNLLVTGQDAVGSAISTGLSLAVKDAAGNSVAYPDSFQSVTSSNTNVVKAAITAPGVAKILGNKAGTATVTATVAAADGTVKSLSTTVTTKSDVVVVKEITTDNSSITFASSIPDVAIAMGLNVKDQYGVTFEDSNVYAYDKLLGIRYTVSDIQYAPGTSSGKVTISPNGATPAGFQAVADANVTEYVLTAISADGTVSASVLVTP